MDGDERGSCCLTRSLRLLLNHLLALKPRVVQWRKTGDEACACGAGWRKSLRLSAGFPGIRKVAACEQ